MPACGTVTTSPACSKMLLRVSPVSSRSFKLIVMEVEPGLEGLEFASVVAEGTCGFACANSSPEGKAGVFGATSAFFSAESALAGGSSGGGPPGPGAAVVGAFCGLATSTKLKDPRAGSVDVAPG